MRHIFHFAQAALLAGATLLCAACGPAVLTERDDGRLLQLHPGNHFAVQLDANPSTGYGWLVAAADPEVIAPGAVTQITPEHAVPGTPVISVLNFQVLRPGHSALRLEYRRPFEKDQVPSKTFAVDVSVD
jgi:inhibitor of cysteine peptidase